MNFDPKKYPYPRVRHHTNPQLYLPYDQLLQKPSGYPPLRSSIVWSEVFSENIAPTVLDIGCGWGNFLMTYATTNPGENILGIEVRASATEWINNVLQKENVSNAYALCYSVVNGLPFIDTGSIEKIMYFFPDPWYKKRHEKRRAFTLSFLDEINRMLSENGTLYLMTDVEETDDYQTTMIMNHGLFRSERIDNDADWFSFRTDQEQTCLRNGIPYIRRKVFKK